MAKGITVTSAVVTISGSTAEVAAGNFVQETVPMNLDILNREVMLVYAIDINPDAPDAQAATNSSVECSISTTSRTAMGNISDTNVLGAANKSIRAAGFLDGGVAYQDVSPETPASNALEYIGIISTSDFFVQVQGFNNLNTKSADWRMWCARARVTADIYAALVQGSALSA